MVCLEKPVLHVSLSALNYLRSDSMENLDNSSYRFVGYKQCTFWVHNILRKVLTKSFHHALYGKNKMSTRQIMMSMYLLSRVKKMKRAI